MNAHPRYDHLRVARPTDHMEEAIRFYRDNLLVLYLPDRSEWERAVNRMIEHGYHPVAAFNPYWDKKGKTFEDVDGYRVVLQQAAWR